MFCDLIVSYDMKNYCKNDKIYWNLLVCIHDWSAMIRTPGWAFRWLILIPGFHLLTVIAIWILVYFVNLLLMLLACIVRFIWRVSSRYIDLNLHIIDILYCYDGTFDIARRLLLLGNLIVLFWAEDIALRWSELLIKSHMLWARLGTSYAKWFRAHTDTFRLTLTLLTL